MGRSSVFRPEFRSEAVELVLASGRTIKEVAECLEISDGTLGNWVRAQRGAEARAADPDRLTESGRDELKWLRVHESVGTGPEHFRRHSSGVTYDQNALGSYRSGEKGPAGSILMRSPSVPDRQE